MAQIRASASLGASDTAMLAHTLKGTAAMLGATDLSLQAAALEKLCKTAAEAGEIRRAVEALEGTARTTRGLLSDGLLALEGTPRAPAAPRVPDRAPALLALAALQRLLEADDLAALELFATERENLAELPDGLFTALESALQDLDLVAACDVCRKINAWALLPIANGQ
jgi:HPt (histidine-containing phosphotransfer) domain-containing protein